MLKDNDIFKLALESSDHISTSQHCQGMVYKGYISGYRECQKTIPSECIEFANWISQNNIQQIPGGRMFEGPLYWYSFNKEDRVCDTTEELFNLYLEETKNKEPLTPPKSDNNAPVD
jgi:hypothetical protein